MYVSCEGDSRGRNHFFGGFVLFYLLDCLIKMKDAGRRAVQGERSLQISITGNYNKPGVAPQKVNKGPTKTF
jgi:hypothetical protein